MNAPNNFPKLSGVLSQKIIISLSRASFFTKTFDHMQAKFLAPLKLAISRLENVLLTTETQEIVAVYVLNFIASYICQISTFMS